MIHAICDFCGQDTGRTSNIISITPFQNFHRHQGDQEPYGNKDETASFVICNKCLEKHNLPNPYHNYLGIHMQKPKYDKCIDSYTKTDFEEDMRDKKCLPMEPCTKTESKPEQEDKGELEDYGIY